MKTKKNAKYAVAYIVGWCCMKGLVPHYKKVEL